jgi:hypothetical protein
VVECQLPKLDVAGSNPVSRSIIISDFRQQNAARSKEKIEVETRLARRTGSTSKNECQLRTGRVRSFGRPEPGVLTSVSPSASARRSAMELADRASTNFDVAVLLTITYILAPSPCTITYERVGSVRVNSTSPPKECQSVLLCHFGRRPCSRTLWSRINSYAENGVWRVVSFGVVAGQ